MCQIYLLLYLLFKLRGKWTTLAMLIICTAHKKKHFSTNNKCLIYFRHFLKPMNNNIFKHTFYLADYLILKYQFLDIRRQILLCIGEAVKYNDIRTLANLILQNEHASK